MNSKSIPQNTYDNFISATICDNEDSSFHENKLHYIFITDENSINNVSTSDLKKDDTYDTFTVQTANSTTTKQSNEEDIVKKIYDIISKLCNERNIIMYVLLADSANKDNNFILIFNKYLVNMPEKYYSNIIIFNFFNSNNINLKAPIESKYKACTKYCLLNIVNISDNSKKYFRVLNVCCDIEFSKKQIDYNYMDVEKYTFNFIHSSSLYNYKELNNLIIERRCSSGKLVQFTGTCWMNAILNALLLPKTSRKYMIEQCKINANTNPELNKIPLYDIYNQRGQLSYENILNSIIYNIFIKKQRPSIFKRDLKNDFVLALADKVKRYLVSIYPDDIGLVKKTKSLKNGHIDFGVGAGPKCITTTVKLILSQYLKDFQHKYRVFLFKLPPKFNRLELNKMEKPHLNKTIIKNSMKYNLTSCLLSQQNGTHMICGFICDGKEYLYNSNTKTAVECNWTNYDYKGYIDYFNQHYADVYNNQINKDRDITIYMENLIYTLETKEEGEYLKTMNKEIEKEVANMVVPNVPCKPINKVHQTQNNITKKCPKPDQELVDGKCRKKCNKNQTRNVITGRCNINKTVKCHKPDQELIDGKCRKKCNENQTRNIITGRCNITRNKR